MGKYHVYSQYSNNQLIDDELPIANVFNPEEIVKRIKSEDQDVEKPAPSSVDKQSELCTEVSVTHCSQKEYAKRLLESRKISFDSILHTFTIIGESDVPHVVRLFLVESCSCPGSPICYHIMLSVLEWKYITETEKI